MEDYENTKPDIPGLVNREKGRKGKKKSNTTSKNSLTLQTFLHDDNKEAAAAGITNSGRHNGAPKPNDDPMESHFAKLNLDDEVC